MVATLGKAVPSYATVKRWVAEFKCGRQSLEDDPRPGRPVNVATPEMVNKVHDIVMTDRQVTERYIASTVGISQERVHSILTEDLEMRKLSARWSPKLLTIDQKHTRRTLLRTNRNLFEEDPANFLKRFVTMDETWVHHFTLTGQTTIETMEAPRLTPAKEGKDCSISWDGYGLGFLGRRWYSADRLYPKRTNDQWYILCSYGKKLKLSAVESSLKVCCSIRTILLFTSLSLLWLPFTIVALN